MPAYKDAQKGTWYAAFYYQDWKGIKKKKLKRGFPTKKEALAWERTFLLQQAADLTLSYEDFVEILIADQKSSNDSGQYRLFQAPRDAVLDERGIPQICRSDDGQAVILLCV